MDNLVNNNYLETFLLLKHVLIDTGTSKSIIKYSHMPNNIYNAKNKISNTYWQVNISNFLILYKVPLIFMFLEFCPTKESTYNFTISKMLSSNYDAIIRHDLLQALGIDILFSK